MIGDVTHTDIEPQIREWGRRLAANLPDHSRSPATRAQQRMMRALIGDPGLRAALFRFVDVRPACRDRADLVRHLSEFLAEVHESPNAQRLGALTAQRSLRAPTALAASAGVAVMARQFIAGQSADQAGAEFGELWRSGRCTTVDLLGEATLTDAEGEAYAARCEATLRALAQMSRAWPSSPLLEHDGLGALPRANLSVKVSALTPHLRANAPGRAWDGAQTRLRALLRLARELGAHLHVDMESLDSREGITALLLELLSEPEFKHGPSAGIVLQGYLTDSGEELDRLLAWLGASERQAPFTVRLVKGAYWDHELVHSVQNGWPAPVFTDRRACDRHYEHLTRRLLQARSDGLSLRVAIASHNLRSLAHAVAYSDHVGLDPDDLELQVLRGLGNDTAAAITGIGRRVRVYSPVGDLVAGMAYLVRRLLENTSNDSFLAAQTGGAQIDSLLEAP